MENKAEISGYVILFIGVALLAFTFVSAYLFLVSNLNIAGSPDLVTVFGVALAPLIETCIRIMYLGVMGWIGSILTIRGVQLVTQLKYEAKPEVKPIVTAIPEAPKQKTAESPKTGKVKSVK